MNTDVPEDFDPEEASTEVLAGREPPPFTQAPDWVGLADISPTARHLHTLLCAHVNQKRAGKKLVWPSTRSLAKMLKLSRRDKVGPFINELVKLKAIDKKRVGMPARNVYVVHALPPEGYDGPLSVAEWYERNREALAAEGEADKVIRTKRAEAKKQAAKEPQVSPDTPQEGYQAEGPVTPQVGQLDTASEGQLVTAPEGRKQEELEPDEVEQGSVPPSEVRRGDAARDGQLTIAGEVEPPKTNLPAVRGERTPSENQVLMGIGRDWLNAREGFGCPMVWRGKGDPMMALRNLIEPALAAGYTEAEVKFALMYADRSVPDPGRLEEALVKVRRGWRPRRDWRPGDARAGGFGGPSAADRPSTTDARVNTAMELSEKYRLQEASR